MNENLFDMAGEPQPLPDNWRHPSVQHYALNVFCVLVQTQTGSLLAGKFKTRDEARAERDRLLVLLTPKLFLHEFKTP